MEDLLAVLETIPDYRVERGKLHNLAGIIHVSLWAPMWSCYMAGYSGNL